MTDTPDVIRDWLIEDSVANATLFAAVEDRVWWDFPPDTLKDEVAGSPVDHIVIRNLTETTPPHNAAWDIILQVTCYPGVTTDHITAARALYRKVFGRLNGKFGTVSSGTLLNCLQQTNVGIVETPAGDTVHVSKYDTSIEEGS